MEKIPKIRVEDNDDIPRKTRHSILRSIEELNGLIDYIEYQEAEIAEKKRDRREPSEGQWPGYDNKIEMNPLDLTVGTLDGLDQLDIARYRGRSNKSELSERRQELWKRAEEIRNSQYAYSSDNFEEKKELIEEARKLIEETIELVEEYNEEAP